ncbi:GNAT family N-acetyltransferase [Alishewanella sp. 16-MA]|uniref:GNAT family N-acetyltransferase n=1 Tax=Alishewanella maricola TaxID=2795740 RepID=A0ABS8C358_9ALTE|nr:GNAT family N-acetyltransferase [Alishewanella maricola]MCB5226717.1 GNAT family N-acetyltransferase [Alishewanella maricola]
MINITVFKTKIELDSFLTDSDLSLIANHSIHVSKSWLSCWCKYFLGVHDLLFFCIHRYGNNIIAVYPLYLKKIALGFELRFIGSGESEISEVSSEFQDFIINSQYLDESLRIFTNQVKKLKNCCKVSFEHVLPDSNCLHWLKSVKKTFWFLQYNSHSYRFTVKIQNNTHEQINALVQTTLRRQARRFVERNDVRISYCQNTKEIQHFMSLLADIHTSQWKSRGKLGAFITSQFNDFHNELAQILLKEKRLLLFKIVCQDFCVAVFYGFYYQETLYYYQSGISEKSPLLNTGVAMHIIAMDHARNHNVKFYDLMAGKLQSYKSHYTKPCTEVLSVSYTSYKLFFIQSIKKATNLVAKTLNSIIKD